MRKNLFAHTAPGGSYPEYISLNIDDGQMELTVRSAPKGYTEGSSAYIQLTRDQARELGQALIAGSVKAV